MAKKMKFGGWINYPGVGIITDEEVYKLVKNHSRLIDRLNGAKMTEMVLFGQNILQGVFSKIDPKDKSWKFYGKGKNSLMNRDWG